MFNVISGFVLWLKVPCITAARATSMPAAAVQRNRQCANALPAAPLPPPDKEGWAAVIWAFPLVALALLLAAALRIIEQETNDLVDADKMLFEGLLGGFERGFAGLLPP